MIALSPAIHNDYLRTGLTDKTERKKREKGRKEGRTKERMKEKQEEQTLRRLTVLNFLFVFKNAHVILKMSILGSV